MSTAKMNIIVPNVSLTPTALHYKTMENPGKSITEYIFV
jgi:hypothetical protein